MQKRSIFIIAIVAVIALMAYPVFAKGPNKSSEKANTGHLYLYEKICSTAIDQDEPCQDWLMPWPIVEGGAWGKMKYNLSGPTFDFVFNGHGLPVAQDFTLIYYPDKHDQADPASDEEWPREDIICLGHGTVNGGGNIHIAGSVPTGNLPKTVDSGDCNYDWAGAKIWLVLSGDVSCDPPEEMGGWSCVDDSPSPYLFEGDVIFFEYTE